MQITVFIEKSAFDAAISTAEGIGHHSEPVNGLQAPLDGVLKGWVEEAWEAVRKALNRCYKFGAEAAKSALQAAEQTVDQVLTSAANRADDVATMLRARLASYVTALIDEMLKQVRSQLSIGEGTLRLAEVHVSQKLVLGGSLKASIKEALALTSSSEFNIEASYRAG